ncbi:sensor histidine kinase [Fodinibius salsisoli]|uniref:histidine kinase n=1 Tax=Fodinibius salsisoli TaxID=2820877 RepID=A0ABT3PQK0_9BACT|nr:ATP-binding protein [Fodinibius salsisoli]MCW9708142.1 PAS domain-containing protein [Fodinibius salsisoli]
MPSKQPGLPKKKGEIRRLIHEKDWSQNPLGPIKDWPSTLSDIVNIILEIDFPIVIGWGKNLISIYNNAYRPLLGKKPESLGRPFLDIWSEARDTIEPQINRALNGKSDFYGSAEFILLRNENPEKAWFDYTFSPIRDSEGNVRGIINIAIEVTSRVQTQKKLKKMNKILDRKVKERTSKLEEYKDQLQALTYQLNSTKEKERNDIARFLHDHVGQLLDLSIIKLDQLKNSAHKDDVLGKISDIKEVLLMANKNTRNFVNELKPPPLYINENIADLLKWLAQKMEKYELEITVEDDSQQKPVSEETHKVLYESVRELCFNIIKHTDVVEASIKLKRADNHILIIVRDTGKGFNYKREKNTLIKKGGFGLFNIRERMKMLGGNLEIISQPGKGTKALLTAPLKYSSKSIYE